MLPFSYEVYSLLATGFRSARVGIGRSKAFQARVRLYTPAAIDFSIKHSVCFSIFLIPNNRLSVTIGLHRLDHSRDGLLGNGHTNKGGICFSNAVTTLGSRVVASSRRLVSM